MITSSLAGPIESQLSSTLFAFLNLCVRLHSTVPRERYFAELCQSIYARHSSVLLMMARSAYELRDRMKVELEIAIARF